MRSAVRWHFQERPWDLYIILGYTFAVAELVSIFDVGNVWAILLLLLVPGYVLVAALFPNNTELDWIERITLSFGLSLAVVTLLVLLLNFVWEIRLLPIVVTISVFAAIVGFGAYARRLRLPVERRLSVTFEIRSTTWREGSSLDRLLTAVLVASVVIAGATFAYAVLAPRPTERFTELYILGPSGNASGYPSALGRGQNATVIIGVANHQGSNVDYTIRVDLVAVRTVYNASSGYNETVELNRTTKSWLNVSLDNEARWTQRYTFAIPLAGAWEVQFLLFKNQAPSSQEVHLFVRVT